jgi:hypothetical protein
MIRLKNEFSVEFLKTVAVNKCTLEVIGDTVKKKREMISLYILLSLAFALDAFLFRAFS